MQSIPIIGISVLTVIKGLVLLALLIYLIFALVVLRQTQIMTRTLKVGIEVPIRFLGIIHLAFAALVFFLALVIL